MKIIIKFTLVLTLSLFSFSSFAQSKTEVKTDVKVEKIEKSETPKEMKFTPETSYIVNDKKVTYEEYAKHLQKKEEEKEKVLFKNSSPK